MGENFRRGFSIPEGKKKVRCCNNKKAGGAKKWPANGWHVSLCRFECLYGKNKWLRRGEILMGEGAVGKKAKILKGKRGRVWGKKAKKETI